MIPLIVNREEVERDFAAVINKHGLDSLTNTPDFILAQKVTHDIVCHADVVKQTMAWQGWPSLGQKLDAAVEGQARDEQSRA